MFSQLAGVRMSRANLLSLSGNACGRSIGSMTEYTIVFARSARKELEALEVTIVNRIFPKIEALAKDPRPAGCRKLHGEKYLWRIRIGDYRVVYAVYDDRRVVDIIAVRHRSKAYE